MSWPSLNPRRQPRRPDQDPPRNARASTADLSRERRPLRPTPVGLPLKRMLDDTIGSSQNPNSGAIAVLASPTNFGSVLFRIVAASQMLTHFMLMDAGRAARSGPRGTGVTSLQQAQPGGIAEARRRHSQNGRRDACRRELSMRSRSLDSACAQLLYCVRWVARKMKRAMAARELSTDIRQMGQIADLRHPYAPRKSKSSRRQGKPPGGWLSLPPRSKGMCCERAFRESGC